MLTLTLDRSGIITLLEYKRPLLRIRVRCSKGTYIRALARDIGEQLGSGGYLKNLRRTRVGPYKVDEGYPLEKCREWFTVKYESV